MTRPERPSRGRPNCPVLTTSVGALAGANDSRFNMLRALKKLLRNSSLAFSPSQREFGRRKFFPKERSSWVNPGPEKILRQWQPGPCDAGGTVVEPGKLAAMFGKTPFCQSCFDGFAIFPPVYTIGMSGQVPSPFRSWFVSQLPISAVKG